LKTRALNWVVDDEKVEREENPKFTLDYYFFGFKSVTQEKFKMVEPLSQNAFLKEN